MFQFDHRSLLAYTAVFCLCAAPTVRASLEEDLLFYAPFDGDTTAALARGNPEATHVLEPRFAPGVRGQALVVGGDPRVEQRIEEGLSVTDKTPRNAVYRPQGNIDLHQGTLSFWVKPLDWRGGDDHFNVLFFTHAGQNYFQVYKFFENDQLLFLVGPQERWTSTVTRIRDWAPGQWHHLAVTWGPDEMLMYQNGHLVCRRRVRFPLENADPVEPFSVGPGGSWSRAFIGHSLVDEFRIHGRPLREPEIRSLYLADAGAVEHDTGLIVLGEHTPTQAGRIADDDYAFDATALETPGQIEVSLETSRVALSYDRESLYLGVLTPLDASASDADERVVLYLSPEPGRMLALSVSADGTISDPLDSGLAMDALRLRQTHAGGSWLVEAAIPFAALGLDRAPDGETWRFNLVRRHAALDETVELAFTAGCERNRAHFFALRFDPDAPRLQIEHWRDARQFGRNARVRDAAPDTMVQAEYISDTTEQYGLRSLFEPLFADGRETPYRSPSWRRSNGADFVLSESRIVEIRGTQSRPLFVRKRITDRADPLRVFYLYTHDSRQLRVSVRRSAPGVIRARFVRTTDQAEALRLEQPLPEDRSYYYACFDLDLEAFRPDTYTVYIDYVAPDGESDEIWQQAYVVPDPDHPAFHPYVDPERDVVPAPWTPVKVSGGNVRGSVSNHPSCPSDVVAGEQAAGRETENRKSKIELSTWGRTYVFGEGFLFDSLVSQGEELLAAPVTLRLDGEALAPRAVETIPGGATGMRAEVTQRADLGALRADVRLVTHFDGYCEIDLELLPPTQGLDVQSLSLDIPRRGEAAQLVRDALVNRLSGSKSGPVGDYWHQGFRGGLGGAYFWVGGGRIGLNWLARDLRAWHNRSPDKQVELIRAGETVIVRLNLVDAPLALGAPRMYRLGFILTPSRPLDPKILRRRELKEFQMWCQPWQYFAVPIYETADTSIIRDALQRAEPTADEVFLYFGGGLTSPFSPEYPWFVQHWRPKGEYGRWTGSHRSPDVRNRITYTSVSFDSDTFFHWMQHTRARFFEQAKTPLIPEATGYYFDCGAIVSDRYREQALHVYRMIRRTSSRARVYRHHGWTRVMPFQHFSDIICGGEAVDRVAQDGTYFRVFTPEMFRASFCPYLYGIKMVHIDMTVRLLKEQHPQRLAHFDLDDPEFRRPLLHSYGYCLVHDVDVHDSNREVLPLRRTIWAAQDALGWDQNVIFHPYWENDAVRRLGDDIGRLMGSAYTKDGRMLLAVLNDTDEQREIALALDLDALGVEAGAEGHDVFDPETRYVLGDRWRDKVPARELRLILWK